MELSATVPFQERSVDVQLMRSLSVTALQNTLTSKHIKVYGKQSNAHHGESTRFENRQNQQITKVFGPAMFKNATWILRPGLLRAPFPSQARVAYEESEAERHFGLKTKKTHHQMQAYITHFPTENIL